MTDPTYKPRRWTGLRTQTKHWWWNPEINGWRLHSLSFLADGDIFLRPDAPKPTEPPPDDLEECSTVDWLEIGVTPPGNEMTILRERLAALENRVAELEKR